MRKLTILAALFLAGTAHAQSLDDVVSNVMKEYGGQAGWQKVSSLRETGTGMAQGMPTANTKLDAVEINAPPVPPPAAAQ